ncbi:MAG: roadblock/LC7 domain-containing protein [Verrucomicrobia bacterium]|nr:roadblock/LC7 domain-containing protein [Verrucomicrobiota bacterium]
MATLPVLIEEDVQRIDAVLADFLAKSEAEAALVTAEGGFVVFRAGNTARFDVTALGTLAANAGSATHAIAKLIEEPNFNTLYQQGQKHSLLVSIVDDYHSLIVLFAARLSVGAVKFYAASAIQAIADQLQKARVRDPGKLIDPISLNLADTTELFKKKR